MIAAAGDESGGFAAILLVLLILVVTVVLAPFPDNGVDQIQRTTESPAGDSSCASGGGHRAG
jgi:hypothetical protein